jgi:hypothetical protein
MFLTIWIYFKDLDVAPAQFPILKARIANGTLVRILTLNQRQTLILPATSFF